MKSRIIGLKLDATNPVVWQVLHEYDLIYQVPQSVRDMALGWANNAFRYERGLAVLDIRILQEIQRPEIAFCMSLEPRMNARGPGIYYGLSFLSPAYGCTLQLYAQSGVCPPTLDVRFGDDCKSETIRRRLSAFGAGSALHLTHDTIGLKDFPFKSSRADIGKLSVAVEGYL